MKKTTKVAFLSMLFFSLVTVPAITTQAATLPFLSSVFDTIVNSILAIGTPTATDVANGRDAVSSKSTYGVSDVDLTETEFDPIDSTDGQINFNGTADDAINVKLAMGDSNSKTRTIDEFQSVSELKTMEVAAQWTSRASKKLDLQNQDVVNTAKDTITSVEDVVKSQPIGTCDSSLCAENTHNILIAQQINLQKAAISIAIMTNGYSKINNNQQAILVKNEEDKKAEEAVKARLDSINNSTNLINRINANRLTKTVY